MHRAAMNKSSMSLRFFVSVVSSASRGMSTKGKTRSHYDTLEINSRATQGEIKSAYFKLSKQYHPDKNKSEEASEKFRDISQAYEVLGNFKNRKIYDRSLIVKPRWEKERSKSGSLDPKMKYYQTQAAIFKHESKLGGAPSYDFDAWTRAHYGRTLQRNARVREDSQRLRELRKDFESRSPDGAAPDQTLLVVSLLLLAGLTMLSVGGSRDDSFYVVERRKERSKAEGDVSPVESGVVSPPLADRRLDQV